MLIVAGNSIHSIISSDRNSSIDIFTIQLLPVLSTVMRPGTIFPVVWLSGVTHRHCHAQIHFTRTGHNTQNNDSSVSSVLTSPHPLATGHNNFFFIHDNLN